MCVYFRICGVFIVKIQEVVKKVVKKHGGVVKSSDLVENGISAVDIVNLCNANYLYRVRHGYYQLAEQTSVSEEKLLAKLVPEGIVCLESALFHYGYSDFTPREWSIAVPRSVSRATLKIDSLPLRVYYVQENLYELGKTTLKINGVSISIYDRERSICDCFRHRSKLDSEIFSKAVNAYANDENKNLRNLSEYAKKLHVYKKVTDLMGVLLNG